MGWRKMKNIKSVLLALLSIFLVSCATTPPPDVNNVCKIFKYKPAWYRSAKEAERRWRVPVAVQMAIIHQESKFDGAAQPPRTKLLWVIPWTRPSTAYGYTQALRTTWDNYKQSNGLLWASRDSFADGVDFIGWYANVAYRRAGIRQNDPYSLYLAYHEGVGGYERKTYLKKPWLIHVAHKVSGRAQIYQAQLRSCRKFLATKSWYNIW